MSRYFWDKHAYVKKKYPRHDFITWIPIQQNWLIGFRRNVYWIEIDLFRILTYLHIYNEMDVNCEKACKIPMIRFELLLIKFIFIPIIIYLVFVTKCHHHHISNYLTSIWRNMSRSSSASFLWFDSIHHFIIYRISRSSLRNWMVNEFGEIKTVLSLNELQTIYLQIYFWSIVNCDRGVLMWYKKHHKHFLTNRFCTQSVLYVVRTKNRFLLRAHIASCINLMLSLKLRLPSSTSGNINFVAHAYTDRPYRWSQVVRESPVDSRMNKMNHFMHNAIYGAHWRKEGIAVQMVRHQFNVQDKSGFHETLRDSTILNSF